MRNWKPYWGAGSLDCQIPLAGDFGIFEMYPLEEEKEMKRVERERIGVSSFKLATVALPIYTNPFNHNPPMKEHS
jgi:hypothetical protein